MKSRILGQEYALIFGMEVLEALADRKKTDYLDEVLADYAEINLERVKISDLNNLAALLSEAITLGGVKSPKINDLKGWIASNRVEMMEILLQFAKSINWLEKEPEGNQKAPKKGAKKGQPSPV